MERTNYCLTCERQIKTKAAYIAHCKSKAHLAIIGKQSILENNNILQLIIYLI